MSIYDPTLVDLTNNFSVLSTNVKVMYIINHSGWSYALMFMKEEVRQAHMEMAQITQHSLIGVKDIQCKQIAFDAGILYG